ncbi:MAG: ATP-binding protein [Planctomycetes bacterium]|nr:ATP-binding protein [Planctomycetota bacterium]
MYKERVPTRSQSVLRPQTDPFSQGDEAVAVLDPPTSEVRQSGPSDNFKPTPPTSLKETGLTDEIVDSIALKYLITVGSAPGAQIAGVMGLPHPLLTERLADLKRRQLVGYVGGATMGDFTYTLTDAGRDRAHRYMDETLYVGAAPVPLATYCEAVKAQSITREQPTEEHLRRAFDDLLVNEHMFATLGPAINSARGMFLYGPPGNGKTSIAERITRCFGNTIYIPRTLHVDGFLVKLFDAEIHEQVPVSKSSILKTDQVDERWVRIRRPTIVAGGELTMDQLEIRYNVTTRISEASTQLKSNCGTLVIDDFGRQRMNPFELLNRWIVPLEKRYDFLALANGLKIQVPFDQLLIFSTNLEPRDLVDEAFLRRIPYKINVSDPSEAEFRELFRMMAPILGLDYDDDVVSYVIDECYRKTGRPFRCCQPRDLLTLAKNNCQYRKIAPHMDREMLDFAAAAYFAVM